MAFTVGTEKQSLINRLKGLSPGKRLDTFRSSQQSYGGASPFSLLTPEEFARLFPDYYKKALPDVAGFKTALSKGTSGKETVYGSQGEASTANVATGEKVTNVVRAKEIYDYLRQKGVDHSHAVGIVNNMKYESNFNSGAIGDGGTSGGLFQHHASRFTAMKNFVGDGWQTDWKKQVDFALTEGEMKTYLSKNYANGKDASVGFTTHFEKPANTDQTAAYRAATADGYSSAMEGGAAAGGQTSGGSYEVSGNGFVVPKDKSMYDQKNEQQCATLAKGFNPEIGRSSSWSVVPGEIKPGVTVATMRYNLPGGDRTGSGYHAGVAMSAPDKDGNFLLLEQFSGRKPQVRRVNANSYDGGAMGGTTQFGLIQSNGKVHNQQSLEALKFGAGVAGEDTRGAILSNHDAIAKGGTTGSTSSTGSVSVNQQETTQEGAAGTPGPQTNLQQQESVKTIQSATIGDMMRFAGDLAGFFSRGEGLGDRGKGRKSKTVRVSHAQDSYSPDVTSSGLSKGSRLVDYKSSHAADAIGISQEEYNAFREAVASIESAGGKYALRGGSSNRFSGAYQMGGQEIKEVAKSLGEEAPVMKVKGKKTPVASDQFINDPLMQERYFDAYVKMHHEHLMKNKKYAEMSPTERTKVLGVAHNAGAGAASKWLRTGNVSSDAFGTHPEKYANRIGKQFSGLQTAKATEATTTQVAQKEAPAKPTQAAAMAVKKTASDFFDYVKSFNPYRGEATASIKPSAGATHTPTKEVFDRMRQMSKPAPAPSIKPELPPGVYSAPADFAPEPEFTSSAKDKQSFNMQQTPPQSMQKPVVIDKFLERSNPQFSSPSLERAMRNASNPDMAGMDHFGSSGTRLG